jgi:diguanylate cyclase (GGDEF)-like protein
MVTITSPNNTIAFPDIVGNNALAKTPSHKHTLSQLQLSTALQTTLDLDEILKLFFKELQIAITLGSLGYRNEQHNIKRDLGHSSKHSCHYQLAVNSQQLGDIVFTRSKRFSEEELDLLEMMIGCLVCPIRNALQYREALRNALQDPLTGAGNRLALDNTLEREIALAQRHHQPLSILVLDIDHFKKINDQFGHATGDCVIRDIAQQMQRSCRDTDAVYRYGGEEFVMLLNHTNEQGAKQVAERLRQQIAESSTSTGDRIIEVTVSVGIASLNDDDDINSLFNRADKALYEAKRNGRNQVAVATSNTCF